ncbi:UDP-N-acetylmuramoyl-L-alanyl-D-glutamate--2,6-diaminopimelate ligase [Paenarthrobacter sp. Z7-10]|uniref:UDP-N-acetylmuramoyl-L-alanyl-D-glutamate--2, 6-diaminopimelate ligase n=1 Tax=Paenarthrobacter sp. Z7-10 TaxID=2787635 RepID=UPI003FA70C2F
MTENQNSTPEGEPSLRPNQVRPRELAEIARHCAAALQGGGGITVTGLTLDSRMVRPGDLYLALPGAKAHGADFGVQAVEAGAAAILTDADGARRLSRLRPFAEAGQAEQAEQAEHNSGVGLQVPVLTVDSPRSVIGSLAALIYGPADREPAMPLLGVTGTNGKTTTTYLINSLLRALGRTTGLIGTIEILAGSAAIPSQLTTPEAPDVHALLALMRERKLDAASMEVSSHALSFGRVDSVVFDAAGFTNLTQDHLDLHGTMEEYFGTKAELFTPERARHAVITVDDEWGRQMAAASRIPTTTLLTTGDDYPGGAGSAVPGSGNVWRVTDVRAQGLGSSFVLRCGDGRELRAATGLPGRFNVSNAALAALMVLASGVPLESVQAALDDHDPFTVQVPGRMQLVGRKPAALVDFAHNPDALELVLRAVRPTVAPTSGATAAPTSESEAADAKVIVVFGATGARDATKRPTMGAIAVRLADVVIITDDDPHDEDAASIRRDVLAGARMANADEALNREILEVFPRADAIFKAVEQSREQDIIVVAGRGHEVWQEVQGVMLPLDDRVELRRALTHFGFTPEPFSKIES